MIVGLALAKLYGAIAPSVTGNLVEGPPTNDYERWLASALLGVTFPFPDLLCGVLQNVAVDGYAAGCDRGGRCCRGKVE